MLEQAKAISPIDGRYLSYTKDLSVFFSEYALCKYRISVELEYFKRLCNVLNINIDSSEISDILNSFTVNEYKKIKKIEVTTNHDVKAIEYYLRSVFDEKKIGFTHLIHFGLTSQDINNTAIPASIKSFLDLCLINKLNVLNIEIEGKSKEWNNVVMISRTHGQPAVPTTMGKEFKVFSYRLGLQIEKLCHVVIYAKFGGAAGNFNAHVLAYPNIDWMTFSDSLVESFGLSRSTYTTQIDNYDSMSELFDTMKRINTILIDLCQDIWLYISHEYFSQTRQDGEIGSSTMPHKINPINFENAEGNFLLANCLFEFFSRKLPISRLQRDLTDSTISRNIGVAFSHMCIALDNLLKGLDKILINKEIIQHELEKNNVVVTEGIQTILRKEGNTNAYETIKKLIHEGNISTTLEEYNISPQNYVGYSMNV